MIDSFRVLCGYRMPRLGPVPYRLFRAFGPKRLDVRLFPGIRAGLDFRDLTQLTTWWQGRRFESPTCDIVSSWLEGATTFFDIGSNYGFFTWLTLSSFPAVRAHAFEPHPKTFALLQSIRDRNDLADRLACWHMGLGDREETLALHPGVEDLGHTSFGNHPELPQDDALAIPVRPFSAWRKENGIHLPTSPEWVAKIDVEGFEPKVLRGMEEELRAKAFRGLVVEINADTLGFCGSSPEEVHSFMRTVGYRALTPETAPVLRGADTANAFFVPT